MTENSPGAHGASRAAGVALASIGFLMLAGLAAFLTVMLGFGGTASTSLPSSADTLEPVTWMPPALLLALLLIGYGRSLLRR